MLDPQLIDIENNRSSFTERKVQKRTARTTTVYQEPYIIKEFFSEKRHRGEWAIEHTVIQYLNERGVVTPKSYGYLVTPQKIALYKEYVPGKLLTEFTPEILAKLASMFVQLHHAGVITRDAHDENVIEADSGELMFIDFGKSKIFSRRTGYYWAILLREHFFIKSKLLKNDERYDEFLERYIEHFGSRLPWLLKGAIKLANAALGVRERARTKHRKG